MKLSIFSSLGVVAALSIFTPTQAQNNTTPRPNTPTTQRPAPVRIDPTTPAGIAAGIKNAETTQNADSLLLLYGQAVTTPDLSRAAISQLLSNYYTLRNQARTADQATQSISEAMLRFSVLQAAQNQVLIQQNQQLLQQNERIITLLEIQSLPPANPNPPIRR